VCCVYVHCVYVREWVGGCIVCVACMCEGGCECSMCAYACVCVYYCLSRDHPKK